VSRRAKIIGVLLVAVAVAEGIAANVMLYRIGQTLEAILDDLKATRAALTEQPNR